MYEVELKAWLDNKIKTETKLRNFATFDALFFKQDTYYHLDSKNITVRIREEEIHSSNNITEKQILVTYKEKKYHKAKDNTSYEVNLENEFTISEKEAFEKILIDSGYHISLKKTKNTASYYFTEKDSNTTFHIELCTIPPIGDFIEIETLTENNSEENTNRLKTSIISILENLNIPKSKIEIKTYKDLLNSCLL